MTDHLEPVRVTIAEDRHQQLQERATRRLAGFDNSATYDQGELLRRNVLGVAGEQATMTWLKAALGDDVQVRDVSDFADGPNDLELTLDAGTIGIEVKTTTYQRWLRHGRAVTEDQLWETDAQIYVWCAGPEMLRPTEIYVVGWSLTSDVRRDSTQQHYTGNTSGKNTACQRGRPRVQRLRTRPRLESALSRRWRPPPRPLPARRAPRTDARSPGPSPLLAARRRLPEP